MQMLRFLNGKLGFHVSSLNIVLKLSKFSTNSSEIIPKKHIHNIIKSSLFPERYGTMGFNVLQKIWLSKLIQFVLKKYNKLIAFYYEEEIKYNIR